MISVVSFSRHGVGFLILATSLAFAISTASAAPAQKKTKGPAPSASIALQYAEAISKGDVVQTARLDFACQYRLVAATRSGLASFPISRTRPTRPVGNGSRCPMRQL